MIAVLHWIIVAMVFYAIGEYCSKKWGNTSNLNYAVAAMMGYMVNAACFLPAISKFNSLTILGTIWNILYVMITLFIGIVIFREPLTTTQIIGVILGFVSIILLSI